MALITLTEAKTHLNIPLTNTNFDAELTDFLSVATDLVQGYADRTWETATVTEIQDGGSDTFLLRSGPVTSVTSVTVDGVALAATAYTVNKPSGIVMTYSATREWSQNVTIVYVVGATVPALAKQATKEAVRHLWQTQRGSMGGRNPLGGEEYSAGMSFSLPRRVMELLDPIRAVN